MTAPEDEASPGGFDDVLAVGREPAGRSRGAIYGSALLVVAIAIGLIVIATRWHGAHRASGTHQPGSVGVSTTSDAGAATGPGEVAADVSAPPPSGPGPTDAASATQAWADFPVGANPRPIVLLGEDRDGPDGGFTSGDAKLAFISGRLRFAIPVPTGPSMSDGYPVISAQDALDRLASADAANPPTSLVLSVTEAQFSTHAFPTDRGMQALPAWRFHVSQSSGDVYVLAVAPAARYTPGRAALGYTSDRAALSPDGRRLTIRYVDRYDSTDPCDPPYVSSLDVVQTPTVVAVVVKIHDVPLTTATDSAFACSGVARADNAPVTPGARDTRTIELDAPLGARVVVTGSGQPYEITQS